VAAWISPETVGRAFIDVGAYGRGLYELVRDALGRLRRLKLAPVRRVFYKQIYFTGIEAIGAVSLIALLAGIAITSQITSLAGQNPPLMAKILLWTIVRELGPLLTAIVIIARSSSATASELATMNIRGELNSLRAVGINPLDYLIVPRLTGITTSVVAVTAYFQIIAVLSGLAVVSALQNISFVEHLRGMLVLLTMKEILVSMLKAVTFGLFISATSCYFGLSVRGSVTQVPQAATRAVMRNLLMLFLLDGLLTYLFLV
jgi:phospholipid/cholesterol/gamma-HCH transport system permease protein